MSDRLPKEHTRVKLCREAGNDLDFAWYDIRAKYDLTASEEFAILTEITSRLARNCVISERREEENKDE